MEAVELLDETRDSAIYLNQREPLRDPGCLAQKGDLDDYDHWRAAQITMAITNPNQR